MTWAEWSPAPRVRALLLAGYVVVTFLSFPHPIGGRVLDLGLALVWLGPGLLLLGLRGLAPRRAAALGLVAGVAAHTAILHWIYVVTVVYGHAPAVAGFVASLKRGLDIDTIHVPERPELCVALGAALGAADLSTSSQRF